MSDQTGLNLESQKQAGPVECLGLTFESDNARRDYFLEELAEKLKDPEFRSTPGFPNGSDEDILRLSDPPYYTACPNPFLAEAIAAVSSAPPAAERRLVVPLAADIAEGKQDSVYTAHSYHTKVPPRAAAKYILHYTEPGDVVLDPFAGSGMTGVAAAMCADAGIAAEYGGVSGSRAAILCDLSPAATMIASVYTAPTDGATFKAKAAQILAATEVDLSDIWTLAVPDESEATVQYQVWVEEMVCPSCQSVVASVGLQEATGTIGTAKEFPCRNCGTLVSKAPTKKSGASRLERQLLKTTDALTGELREYVPRRPLLTQLQLEDGAECRPTSREAIAALRSLDLSSEHWAPTDPVIQGERAKLKDCLSAFGITRVHHFYLPRQLRTFSTLWHYADQIADPTLRRSMQFFLQSFSLGMTLLNRYAPKHYSQVNRHFSGTLYIPSLIAETSIRYTYKNKMSRLCKTFDQLGQWSKRSVFVTTQSATDLASIPAESIDYVFVDPPFGRNLQYSELNQIWESWLRVRTERDPEAVIDAVRGRGVTEYSEIMRSAFKEMHRVLKAGRWISVVFHNSSNAVWNGIQEAIAAAGFVVADVRGLGKETQTYKQIRQGLMKQDLVISAYKATESLSRKLEQETAREEVVWTLVEQHLGRLRVAEHRSGTLHVMVERTDQRLYDRTISFFVQRLIRIPISAPDFYSGLAERFPERDGMYFLSEQVAEYDKKRMRVDELQQLELFVNDEASAVQWVRLQLQQKPRTLQDLTPEFLRELQAWAKHEETVELRDILELNFLRYDGTGPVPNPIHSYLSSNFKDLRNLDKDDPQLRAKAEDRWYVPDPGKQADLEKLRERTLLREFGEYRESTMKLKHFRTEAVRAGFKACYDEGDYQAIVAVGDRLPEAVLQEDEKLLMYYDVASMRIGDA